MESRLRTALTQVLCPFSSGKPFTVFTPFFIQEDGKPFFLPCNGCDHMSGDSTCSRCCAYVTLRLNGLDYSADDARLFTLLPPSATPA